MKCIHIITPVKDSIELTLQTVDAIMASDFKTPFTYTIYNDFSTEENTARLQEASARSQIILRLIICKFCKWRKSGLLRKRPD